mgnify:FL=1
MFRKFGRDSLLLATLAYNVGPYRLLGSGKIPKSKLIRKLEAGDRDIYKEYISYCHYKGRKIRSIERRRKMEFLLLFNQAATDRAELSKLLHISDTQLSYITNAEAGHGLLRMGGSIVPFVNTIPRQTELYKLMTTTPGENLV